MKFVPRRACASREGRFSSRTEFANPDQAMESFRVTVNDFGVGAFWRLTTLLPIADSHSPVVASEVCSGPLIMTAGCRPMFYKITEPYFCWICGNVVNLETCKTDEHGVAVHEDCYMARIALAHESVKLSKLPPRSANSALMFSRIQVRRRL